MHDIRSYPTNSCQTPQPACQFPPSSPRADYAPPLTLLPLIPIYPLHTFPYRASDKEHGHSSHNRNVSNEWLQNHPQDTMELGQREKMKMKDFPCKALSLPDFPCLGFSNSHFPVFNSEAGHMAQRAEGMFCTWKAYVQSSTPFQEKLPNTEPGVAPTININQYGPQTNQNQ